MTGSQLLIALVMAALYAVGFAIVGLPAWAGVAVLAGLLNVIPYVGTTLGLALAIGFTLGDGGSFWRIGGVVSVFAIVQAIEGYYLMPRILGARLSLHPRAVFLGLLIGGKLFGLLGVILAVPTIAVAKVFLMFFREICLFWGPTSSRSTTTPTGPRWAPSIPGRSASRPASAGAKFGTSSGRCSRG
ncbi:MAG: AI-2E family transporter [Blastocatellia bacterium]